MRRTFVAKGARVEVLPMTGWFVVLGNVIVVVMTELSVLLVKHVALGALDFTKGCVGVTLEVDDEQVRIRVVNTFL